MRRERVLVFNGYGTGNKQGPALARWIKNLRAKVAIISELGYLGDDLSKVGKVFANAGDTPRDTAVLVAGRLPRRLSWLGWQVTKFIRRPGSPSPRLWRDRWVVRVKIWRRVYYSIHANALIADDGRWRKGKGAEVWREALKELKADIQADIDKNLRVRVGGDFNFPKSDVPLSPNRFFESLGLDHMSDGRVMWFAWDPRKDVLVEKRVMGVAPGADAHGSLLAVLRKRRRSER